MDSLSMMKLRCPQNWGLDSFLSQEAGVERSLSNLSECEDDEGEQKYASNVFKFIKYCHMSYEKYRNKKYNEALQFNNNLMDITDDFMDKYDRVFKHVHKASRIFILNEMGSTDKAKTIFDEINKDTFSAVEETCFDYMKSRMLLVYVSDGGPEESLKLARSVILLVNDEAEFHYSLVNILSRIRHFKYPPLPPTEEEFKAAKTAFSLKPTLPTYAVGLAKLYMESRFQVPWDKRAELSNTAASIFRKLLENHGSLTGNDIARCIFQLMKIAFDPDLEQYAEIALKKSDAVLTNHYIGLFYIRNQQYDLAHKCYSKVWDVLPYLCGPLLLLQYRLNDDYLTDSELEDLLLKWSNFFDKEKNDTHLKQFHLSISQFYLLVRCDLVKATSHFLSAYKYGISDKDFISLTRNLNSTNYFKILNMALLADASKNPKSTEAREALKKLPANIFNSDTSKSRTATLQEVRKHLF